MGIPKFFRWISERYPLCSQLVVPNEIPEFDNFYLDMNGIIHNCSRPPAGANQTEQLEEHQMFIRIFGYIDDLFHKIKPKKIFFLAVDGVAPRAKMNQQRSRRFRSAKEKQLDPKWNDSCFDSNCITPGTLFMQRLDEHLKYFLQKKISEDPFWQHVTIIYSGHDVPGEGEHKIMEYIRLSKAQSDYDPNVRHCLYGLDADLIMLGLVTHDPHFCLLREEVLFGKKQIKTATNFHLLHLCLLREYIDLEFRKYFQPDSSSLEYSLERILDDFILFSVLVGNDFLPSLSFILIHEGAYELLFENYIKCITANQQYLNEFGKVNFKALKQLIDILAETEATLAVSNAKFLTPSERNALNQLKNFIGKNSTQPIAFDQDLGFIRKICHKGHITFELKENELWLHPVSSAGKEKALKVVQNYLDSKVSSDELLAEWKAEYYLDKIGNNDKETISAMCRNYLEGIQWVMLYYFEGVPSWSWYYGYHYAPKIVDIALFLDEEELDKIDFELSEPFKPFEQLMAVLPAFSSSLVPATLASLMHDQSSPIIHFYPYDFKTDLNGKQQEWEAVVLIPFIDEALLLRYVRAKEPFLDEQETFRNSFGTSWIFYHAEQPVTNWVPRINLNPTHFPNIKSLKCSCLVYNLPVLATNQEFVKGLCEGVRLGVHAIPGFPTLSNISLACGICNLKVKVFSNPSKFPSLLLTILTDSSPLSDEHLLKLIGKTVYYRWPYLLLSQIETISDGICLWDKDGKHEISASGNWDSVVDSLENDFYSRKAVNIGCTNYLVSLKPFVGIKELADGSKIRTFSPQTVQFPLQLIVTELFEEDKRFVEEGPKAIAEVLDVGSNCIYVGPNKSYYGGLMTVSVLHKNSIGAMIEFLPNNFSFESQINQFLNDTEGQYFVLSIAATKIGCSAIFLIIMTSPFYIEVSNNQRVNIGFPFKYESKKLRVPGYSKKINNIWSFSSKVIEIMRDFVATFPDLLKSMEKKLSRRENINSIADVLPFINDDEGKKAEILKVKRWITEHVPETLDAVPLHGEKLSDCIVGKCVKLIDDFVAGQPIQKAYLTNVPLEELIRPSQADFTHSNKTFKLGDRAVFTSSVGSIPIGMHCTIVGILDESKYQILTDSLCHGLFETNDSAYPGRLFILTNKSLLNITNALPTVKQSSAVAEKDQKLKNILKASKQEPDSSAAQATTKNTTTIDESKATLKAGLLKLVKSKNPSNATQPPVPTVDGSTQSSTSNGAHVQSSTKANGTPSASKPPVKTNGKPAMEPSVIQFFNNAKQSSQVNDAQYFTPDHFV